MSVLRPPRLIGRDAEWQRLHADWSAGQPSLVAGEAGLGKSRLIGDFAQAQPGALAVDARPGDARVPHTLLSRLLRLVLARLRGPLAHEVAAELAHLLPELGRATRLGATRAGFASSLRSSRLLRQALADGVAGLVVDDLQFADAASVEAMQQLAGARLGLRWIVAFRAHELEPAAQSFHDALLGAHGARLQVLQPLAADHVGALIDSLGVASLEAGRLAPALARHTGGNPMFLLETLKLMLAPVAASTAGIGSFATGLPTASNVAHLIGQRIERLSPMAVKLARCAAIAGADFSADLAAHVLGLRAIDLSDAWSELEAAQVLREGAFAHDLIFEAARGSVPAPIARQLHAEMAGFLEARSAEPAQSPSTGATPATLEGPALAGRRGRTRRRRLAAGRGRRAAAPGRAHRPPEGRTGPAPSRCCGGRIARYLQASLGSPAISRSSTCAAAPAVARSSAATPTLRAPTRSPSRPRRRRRGRGAHRPCGDRRRIRPGGRRAPHVDLVSALANGLFIQDRPDQGAEAVRAAETRMLGLGDRPPRDRALRQPRRPARRAQPHIEAQAALGT